MSMAIIFVLAAFPPDVPQAVQIIEENKVYVLRTLVGEKSLYTYDRDEPGKSNCTGPCATAWPPLRAPASAKPVGKWTVMKRADGVLQWAYDGKPVYTYQRDKPAVASGDGIGGIWHLLPATPVG
jgi:predicted lipoprotein with Yx(FWY)xxD motif